MDLPSQSTHESFDLVYFEPGSIRFAYDGQNLTMTDRDGAMYPRVTLRRCFPLSAKNTNILVKIPETEKEHDQELGMIADIQELDAQSLEAVLKELDLFYFVPAIRRIVKIREEFGFLYWSVETDRGEKEFVMRDSPIGSVRKVSEGRYLIIDINQTRYEVPDMETLDLTSQNLIRRYLLL
jgi:hypothetical protein